MQVDAHLRQLATRVNSKWTEQILSHVWVLYHDRHELHDRAPPEMPQSRAHSGREEQ